MSISPTTKYGVFRGITPERKITGAIFRVIFHADTVQADNYAHR